MVCLLFTHIVNQVSSNNLFWDIETLFSSAINRDYFKKSVYFSEIHRMFWHLGITVFLHRNIDNISTSVFGSYIILVFISKIVIRNETYCYSNAFTGWCGLFKNQFEYSLFFSSDLFRKNAASLLKKQFHIFDSMPGYKPLLQIIFYSILNRKMVI